MNKRIYSSVALAEYLQQGVKFSEKWADFIFRSSSKPISGESRGAIIHVNSVFEGSVSCSRTVWQYSANSKAALLLPVDFPICAAQLWLESESLGWTLPDIHRDRWSVLLWHKITFNHNDVKRKCYSFYHLHFCLSPTFIFEQKILILLVLYLRPSGSGPTIHFISSQLSVSVGSQFYFFFPKALLITYPWTEGVEMITSLSDFGLGVS